MLGIKRQQLPNRVRKGLLNSFSSMSCFLLAVVCLLSSCGYTTKSTLPSRLRTIHIEAFENKIDYASEGRRNLYLPLLEVKVRNAVVDRFLFDGNLRAAEADRADLILKGKLIQYQRVPLRYSGNNDTEEYRVEIVVGLELWDTENEVLMWQETRFGGDATYFISGSQATTEDSAIDEAIEDLARRIVERTVEDW